MAWTEDRVEKLTKLWAEGLSASQIAKELGEVTRNAVIGKVHRLGLSGRAKPSRPKQKAAPKTATATTAAPAPKARTPRAPSAPRTPQQIVAAAAVPAPPPLEAKPMSNGEFATIMTITDHMCKWPIGDPTSSEFRFCGRKTDPDEPYCVAHSRVAYQPSRRRGASSNTKALGPSPTSRKRLR
ncbi:Global cell cycle regulator GcrA [Litorimonas taeanensis]|uniref:Global cell cycle regulator GcrA n=1 Tax=Litorimonas taeanensis TaxID=568099 RepID=A0A420WLJ6_9PROT|nr:GcrA family cell cycle regulator [Litorimonas taeanensis]RKQ71849.1 Global cell cycle regulator GcrA [Litorimonas taeanensis]